MELPKDKITIESDGNPLNTHVYFTDENGVRHELTCVQGITWAIAVDDLTSEATLLILNPELKVTVKPHYVLGDTMPVKEGEFRPMREVDIPPEVFKKLADPNLPDPVVDEDDNL